MTTSQLSRYGYADLEALMALMTGDEKHGPAATSTLDVLWVLYDRVLPLAAGRPCRVIHGSVSATAAGSPGGGLFFHFLSRRLYFEYK
jgi:hypothetical protein